MRDTVLQTSLGVAAAGAYLRDIADEFHPNGVVFSQQHTSYLQQDGRWELSLIFPAVSQQMFKPYRLYARNELGNNNNTAWLVRGELWKLKMVKMELKF